MRKIEREMIAAIRNGRSRSIGNTTVRCNDGGAWAVLLHGNLIADYSDVRGLQVTLAGWPTPTTRSRINAILRELVHSNAAVYQERHAQYIHLPACEPREIGSLEWINAA